MDFYSKQLPLLWDADVIVVGSGTAGAYGGDRGGAQRSKDRLD